jgi:hypothetical protein
MSYNKFVTCYNKAQPNELESNNKTHFDKWQ